MNSPAITYAPRPDATPELEISVLAAAYRFVLETADKEAAGPRQADDLTDARERIEDAGTQDHCT